MNNESERKTALEKWRFPSILIASLFIWIGASAFLPFGGRKQPIDFNHAKHTELNIPCQDCHHYVLLSEIAGIPSIEACRTCHEKESDNRRTDIVRRYLKRASETGEGIEWVRICSLPPDVVFSHKRHVKLGGLMCSECHGDMGWSTHAPTKPWGGSHGAKMDRMYKCLDCHEKRMEGTDCLTCHG